MFSAGRVLLMPKGAYNPLTTYEMLDIVSYNGSSYIAKGTTTGNLPTDGTYWQLSAYGGQAANIAGNFAELESSSVATATHYVDDIFVDENSQLMKATQTINIGDTIDANVNCAPTTVEALIAYLSSYVDSLDSLNKKIQGAIEIAAQTDLHSLAIGEYYKKQSTFYITNGPTGIDQDPTAIFRLTVEAALDNASQASSPLLLTLRTPDGKIYTQGFDGTSWGSWKQIAVESSVADVNTRVNSVESSVADVETSSTASKTYAIGESFYYSDVLYKATAPIPQGGTITPGTNCTPEKIIEKIDDLVSENQTLTNKVANEIATRAKVSGHNFGKITNPSQTGLTGLDFTVNSDGSINVNGTSTAAWAFIMNNAMLLKAGSYTLSSGIGANPNLSVQVTNAEQSSVFASTENSAEVTFTLNADTIIVYRLFYTSGQTFNNVVVYPMLRLATDENADYAPYSMTNQEMTPYVQAISNPNLLDNPWFTVNQRGQSSYSSGDGGLTFDRWKLYGGSQISATVAKSNDVITITKGSGSAYTQLGEKLEDYSLLEGKTLTMSVLLADGTIKSGTAQFVDASTNFYFLIESGDFALSFTAGYFSIVVYGASKQFKAFKLELGSVSTLAQDTAPNYATELLKCQRYFQRIKRGSTFTNSIGFGFASSETQARIFIPLPVEMRATPTATISSLSHYRVVGNGGVQTPSAISVTSKETNGVNVNCTGTSLITNQIYNLNDSGDETSYIDLSADL